MKLELDYLRDLLIEVEQTISKPKTYMSIDENDDFRRWYHFNQLFDAGYLNARDSSNMGGRRIMVHDLSFSGHQLLSKMRNDNIWQKTKQKIADIGGDVPVRILEKFLDQGWEAIF